MQTEAHMLSHKMHTQFSQSLFELKLNSMFCTLKRLNSYSYLSIHCIKLNGEPSLFGGVVFLLTGKM